MTTTTILERTLKLLEQDGLVVRDGETITVTPRGDEYTRALIARCRAHNKPNSYMRDKRNGA